MTAGIGRTGFGSGGAAGTLSTVSGCRGAAVTSAEETGGAGCSVAGASETGFEVVIDGEETGSVAVGFCGGFNSADAGGTTGAVFGSLAAFDGTRATTDAAGFADPVDSFRLSMAATAGPAASGCFTAAFGSEFESLGP